jgi:single-strand DNA-binding protein
MNEHTIVGNLTRDPQLHHSQATGRAVTTFDLAVNQRRLDRTSGEYVEQPPVFHRVVCYGPQAENAAESLRRGVEVVVIGRFVDDSYDQDGQRQRRIILEAELVAASLRWAIARPVKVDRRPTTSGQPQPNSSD